MPAIQPAYTITELTKIYIDNELRDIEKFYLKNNSNGMRVDMLHHVVSMDHHNGMDTGIRRYIHSKFKLLYEEMCAAAPPEK